MVDFLKKDPSIAARLFRSVLDAHQLLEQRA